MDHSPPKPSVMHEDQPAGHCKMQMKQKLRNGAEIIYSDQFRLDKAPAGVEEAQYGETPNLQFPEEIVHIVVPSPHNSEMLNRSRKRSIALQNWKWDEVIDLSNSGNDEEEDELENDEWMNADWGDNDDVESFLRCSKIRRVSATKRF
ncbi:uncharacterized protein LOC110938829 isoform X2 [Helianthus annuus]|uniref:uncharacterized protein LOC110938829 isoform X2 n=1 Tax=Helianthus annuus TaxID=4232 RepID=UPI000B903C2D|nr:uncharacterized protein LOC110938829 isoform X2 [Helianthus annuus]